jgi:hypothetical protein
MSVEITDRIQDGKPAAALPAWTWPPEVLAFAKTAGVADYLDPLLQETRALFPTAPPRRVMVEDDPEIPNDRHIVWEIDIPFTGTSDYLQSQKRWVQALCRVCPAPLTCVFCLLLMPVPNGPA